MILSKRKEEIDSIKRAENHVKHLITKNYSDMMGSGFYTKIAGNDFWLVVSSNEHGVLENDFVPTLRIFFPKTEGFFDVDLIRSLVNPDVTEVTHENGGLVIYLRTKTALDMFSEGSSDTMFLSFLLKPHFEHLSTLGLN
jgi:hypothetical protein